MEVAIEGNLSASTSVDVTRSNTDPTKRPTFAEKLVGVKNTQCDQHLARVQQKIDHGHTRNIQKIREETNRISYDFKEIKVNQKKRELEVKKKTNPRLDTEQDEFEIMKAEKYMIFNPNICFYTNKKNTIPIRSQAKLDPFHVTTTVATARKMLQDKSNERHVQHIQEKQRALMHSRKSAHSVRFNISNQGEAADDTEEDYPRRYNKFRTPSPEKTHERYPSPTHKSHSSLHPKKSLPSTPHATGVVDPSEIPDDFTQCPSRHLHAHTKVSNNNIDEAGFHLPTMTSQQRAQSYLNYRTGQDDSTLFSELEKDLPAHELRLLKEASDPHRERATKSAVIRRTPSQLSQYSKRYPSASTAASKKRQFTHSVMRRENRDVQMKVQYFLRTFEQNKKKRFHRPKLSPNPEDKQIVTFDVPDGDGSLKRPGSETMKRPSSEVADKELVEASEDQDSRLVRAKTAVPRHNGDFQTAAASGRFFYGAQRVASALAPQEKPKKKVGIPHHSQDRSRRHTATFKLRRVVEDLIKSRTTHQILEYEKMKTEQGHEYKMSEQENTES